MSSESDGSKSVEWIAATNFSDYLSLKHYKKAKKIKLTMYFEVEESKFYPNASVVPKSEIELIKHDSKIRKFQNENMKLSYCPKYK